MESMPSGSRTTATVRNTPTTATVAPASASRTTAVTEGVDGQRCPACDAPVVAGASACPHCRHEIDAE